MALSCYGYSAQIPDCTQQASSGEHLNQKHRGQRRFSGMAGWEEEEGLWVLWKVDDLVGSARKDPRQLQANPKTAHICLDLARATDCKATSERIKYGADW